MIRKIATLVLALCAVAVCAYAGAPEYTGSAVVTINDGIPQFDELTTNPYIDYDPLDKWERASKATACLGPETIAQSGRTAMQSIEPSGWQNSTYDFIPGYNLYHRCHLIGDQLGGNECAENLVTGTQYMNIVGMLPIETQIAEYIKSTGNHVLYRVWPYYRVADLVCLGVQIEAQSVEDDEIRINVYCHNVQPGVHIDYRTGINGLASTSAALEYVEKSDEDSATHVMSTELTYVLNTNTKKFHKPECLSVKDIKPNHKVETTLSRDEVIAKGYAPCKRCLP